MSSPAAPRPPRRPRWGLLGVVLLTAVGALAVIWWGPQMSRQHRFLRTWLTLLLLVPACLVWLMAFSRLKWRTRWRTLGLVLTVGVGLGVSIRQRGFTGDMVPVFEWRWGERRLMMAQGTPGGVVAPAPPPGAADYAQFLGPERQARVPGPVLARDWKRQPPELLWKHPVGTAWSPFAIAGRRAVTQEQRGGNECVTCYDLLTGDLLWEQHTTARYTSPLAGEGPRATPTLEGDRCYTQGAMGHLQCLDLATGAVIWSADTVATGALEGKAKVLEWGMSASPCLEGPLVLAAGPEKDGHPAASVIAFNKSDGTLAWKAGRSGGAYSSPLVGELSGRRQVVYFGPDALTGYALEDGAELWSFRWPRGHPHVCMPLWLGGDDVLVSSGYGTGSGRLHISKTPEGPWSVEELWRTNKLRAKFTNLVRAGDFIYGLDDGVLACLDARDGTRRWREGAYRHGQVILVGALLLLMAEDGDVVLLDPQPDAPRELTRFTALAGKTWNPPALAGCYLVVRNDLEAACYRLPVGK